MRSPERRLSGGLATAIASIIAVGIVWPAAASSFDEAMDTREGGNSSAQQSQSKIDTLANETDSLLTQYRNVLNQLDAVRVFNKHMRGLIAEQETEKTSLVDQIDNIELVARQMTPHMLKMIDSLERFVELDVPFLTEERTDRVAFLRDAMGKSDVSDSEKYRAIMEAYQIENEFGRTIEAYEGELEIAGEMRAVDFLRLGRVSLLYRSYDGSFAGAWDQKERAWVELGRSYDESIKAGLRMARDQTAPSLILAPVLAAEEAS
jgi:archaellum component FlaC